MNIENILQKNNVYIKEENLLELREVEHLNIKSIVLPLIDANAYKKIKSSRNFISKNSIKISNPTIEIENDNNSNNTKVKKHKNQLLKSVINMNNIKSMVTNL